eukprot:m51a1_g7098 putative atp-sensitive inward rectifier potassium channel 15 (285) ;mRNA; r:47245-48318
MGDAYSWGFFVNCVWFSVQTGETIGYGLWAPLDHYANFIMCLEMYITSLYVATLAGIMFAKISRPTRIAHQIIFSDVAVVNSETRYFDEKAHTSEAHQLTRLPLRRAGAVPCISFRVATMRKALCDPRCTLLLMRKEPVAANIPCEQSSGGAPQRNLAVYELHYEINYMTGRGRAIAWSNPHMYLPITITHAMDELSPLRGCTPQSLREADAEIICIIDGIDEAVSMSVQGRWSYVPDEIEWGKVFEPMVAEDLRSGNYVVDFKKLNATHRAGDDSTPSTPNPR